MAAWDTVTGERQWSYTYHASHPTGLEASFDGLGEALYVFGQGPWTSRIVSSLGGQTLADHSASKVSDLLPIGCPGLLLSTSQFGLESRSSKTGRLRWTRQDPKEGGWILRSAGGFLDGSFDAINGGLIDLDGRSVLLREHADVLVDPKRVKAEIAGVAVQSPQVK